MSPHLRRPKQAPPCPPHFIREIRVTPSPFHLIAFSLPSHPDCIQPPPKEIWPRPSRTQDPLLAIFHFAPDQRLQLRGRPQRAPLCKSSSFPPNFAHTTVPFHPLYAPPSNLFSPPPPLAFLDPFRSAQSSLRSLTFASSSIVGPLTGILLQNPSFEIWPSVACPLLC